MKEKLRENKTFVVAVATVAILVIIFAGITYAFFTTNTNLDGSTIAVTGGQMNIYYGDGTNDLGGKLTSEDFQPSNEILVDKTFLLMGYNTAIAGEGLDMDYYIGIEYNSSFTDGQLHWYLKRLEEETINGVTYKDNKDVTSTITGEIAEIPGHSEYTGYYHGTFDKDDVYIKLVTGTFKPSTEEQVVIFNLKIQFPDTGENQDENKGATFTGKIIINEEKKSTIKRTGNMVASLESRYNSGDTDLMQDDTDDHNIRYVGTNPNNYVSFNDELWRIIGVFDTYDVDDDGNALSTHSRKIKLIRAEAIGDYSFDVSENGECDGSGCDEWSISDLMTELNGDYLNQNLLSNPLWKTWDNSTDTLTTTEFDRTKAIKTKYQNMIASVVWNTGSFVESIDESIESYSALNLYNSERGNTIATDDDITRSATWNGKIGLAYWSDYGYSSTSNECRENMNAKADSNSEYCQNDDINDSNHQTDLHICYNETVYCNKENWLLRGYVSSDFYLPTSSENAAFWTLDNLSVLSGTNYLSSIIFGSGVLFFANPISSGVDVIPSLYLKKDIIITSGSGTKNNPYILSEPAPADEVIKGSMVEEVENLLLAGNTDLMKDDTEDANTRYVGSNPNNYVSFNNELWRIIGVFDTYDSDDDGNTLNKHSKKIKLIRAETLGEYSYSSYTNEDYTSGDFLWGSYYSQDYSIEPCALMRELNGDYLNPNLTSNPNWFNGLNTQTAEFDRTKALSTTAQSMIANIEWKMGTITSIDIDNAISPKDIYEADTGNSYIHLDENILIEADTTWNGKVGLMYGSDYYYASENQDCRENILSENEEHNTFSCGVDNWLNIVPEGYATNFDELDDDENNMYLMWTMTRLSLVPTYTTSLGFGFLFTYDDSFFTNANVYPSLYLNPSVKITGGTGTSTDPYQLALS